MEIMEAAAQLARCLSGLLNSPANSSPPQPSNLEASQYNVTLYHRSNSSSLSQVNGGAPLGVVTPPLSPTSIPRVYSGNACRCADCQGNDRAFASGVSGLIISRATQKKTQPKANQDITGNLEPIIAAPPVGQNNKDSKSAESLVKSTSKEAPARKSKESKKSDDDLIKPILSLDTLSIMDRQDAVPPPASTELCLSTTPKRKRDRADEPTPPRKQPRTKALSAPTVPDAPDREIDMLEVEQQENPDPEPTSFAVSRASCQIMLTISFSIEETRIVGPTQVTGGQSF